MPNDDITELYPELIAHHSGPDLGIGDVSLISFRKHVLKLPDPVTPLSQDKEKNDQLAQSKDPSPSQTNQINTQTDERQLIYDCWDSFQKCGITKWNLCHHRAYGIACSLYENNLIANYTVGDPIADTYAIMARKNSCIQVLGDGVNWGPRSRLASRCAVRACMNYINRKLFFSQSKPRTTHDVFKIICRGFDAAQEFILQCKGTMTTLCCSVTLKLKDSSSSSSSNGSSTNNNNSSWVVCTLSIGDSTSYVFNRSKGVFELTWGARNIHNDRDMRNVGGALGHVYGNKPDVSNMNYSLMYIKENDIVFLVSDGVSDNLDPIVSQTARRVTQILEPSLNSKKTNDSARRDSASSNSIKLKKSPSSVNSSPKSLNQSKANETEALDENFADDQSINLSSLPEMSPYERYICSLAHMNEILLRNKTLNDELSAQETCAILIEHVMRLTANKREILEKGFVDAASLNSEDEKKEFQARLRERVQKLRGKLDHASICAYEVGTIFQ